MESKVEISSAPVATTQEAVGKNDILVEILEHIKKLEAKIEAMGKPMPPPPPPPPAFQASKKITTTPTTGAFIPPVPAAVPVPTSTEGSGCRYVTSKGKSQGAFCGKTCFRVKGGDGNEYELPYCKTCCKKVGPNNHLKESPPTGLTFVEIETAMNSSTRQTSTGGRGKKSAASSAAIPGLQMQSIPGVTSAAMEPVADSSSVSVDGIVGHPGLGIDKATGVVFATINDSSEFDIIGIAEDMLKPIESIRPLKDDEAEKFKEKYSCEYNPSFKV